MTVKVFRGFALLPWLMPIVLFLKHILNAHKRPIVSIIRSRIMTHDRCFWFFPIIIFICSEWLYRFCSQSFQLPRKLKFGGKNLLTLIKKAINPDHDRLARNWKLRGANLLCFKSVSKSVQLEDDMSITRGDLLMDTKLISSSRIKASLKYLYHLSE